MADAIGIDPGTLPWQPAEFNTQKVAEYHRYDIPLVGVVEQADVLYLFQCFFGAAETVSLWAYSMIDPEERETLDAVDDAGLDDLVTEIVNSRPGMVAVAMEGYGIVHAGYIEDWDRLPYVVEELIHALDERLDSFRMGGENAKKVIAAK